MSAPDRVSLPWQRYFGGIITPSQLRAELLAEMDASASPALFAVPDDDACCDAPGPLVVPSHFYSASWLRQSVRANWAHCDARLMVWSAMLVAAARKRQIPLYVHTALRDRATQDDLRAQGFSKALWPRSAHNIGEAVDIVHGTRHWDMGREQWRYIHALGQRQLDKLNARLKAPDRLHLRWGGNFKSLYDPAHYEIVGYRSRIRQLPDVSPVSLTPAAILSSVANSGRFK